MLIARRRLVCDPAGRRFFGSAGASAPTGRALRLLNTDVRLGRSLALPRGTTEHWFGAPNDRTTLVGCLAPRTSFSMSSVVSNGFPLITPLLNKCMRYLPGLRPTLRFLAQAIRGHVIPRHSAAKKTTHPRSQNNLLCLHRSQHSRLRFQPPLKPPHLQFLFRVFRGEPWFPVENTVIEQVHARLARAKAHATVFVLSVISDARGQK
jgi:hypothetical protein